MKNEAKIDPTGQKMFVGWDDLYNSLDFENPSDNH